MSAAADELVGAADELVGAADGDEEAVAVADEALVLGVLEVADVELPAVLADVDVLARWACAAWPTNRPRLAAPAVTTTATANRARLRRLFMAPP